MQQHDMVACVAIKTLWLMLDMTTHAVASQPKIALVNACKTTSVTGLFVDLSAMLVTV